jgi:hypothetical protein
MWSSRLTVIPAGYNSAALDENSSDRWVWACHTNPLARFLQGQPHKTAMYVKIRHWLERQSNRALPVSNLEDQRLIVAAPTMWEEIW